MRNTLAIARRELHAYFSSPIAYIMVGLFALLFGWMFYSFLSFFSEQSLRMSQFGMAGPHALNVNEMLIRPLLLQAGIIILIFVPTLTMRTFAEEKRSGTIELLLTSPLTDWEIVLGKFLGAVGLYAVMLLLSSLNLVWLFVYGDPELAPVVTGFVGLLLLGAGFIAIGLFLSNLTRNQIVAGLLTYAALLMLLLVSWVGESAGPVGKAIVSALSVFQHFEDFSKGVVDTQHVIYYLSVITFGLFLTARSVDADRWRG
ncbi:MAG: ABC transporter permease [Luteitalea sp.]